MAQKIWNEIIKHWDLEQVTVKRKNNFSFLKISYKILYAYILHMDTLLQDMIWFLKNQ